MWFKVATSTHSWIWSSWFFIRWNIKRNKYVDNIVCCWDGNWERHKNSFNSRKHLPLERNEWKSKRKIKKILWIIICHFAARAIKYISTYDLYRSNPSTRFGFVCVCGDVYFCFLTHQRRQPTRHTKQNEPKNYTISSLFIDIRGSRERGKKTFDKFYHIQILCCLFLLPGLFLYSCFESKRQDNSFIMWGEMCRWNKNAAEKNGKKINERRNDETW